MFEIWNCDYVFRRPHLQSSHSNTVYKYVGSNTLFAEPIIEVLIKIALIFDSNDVAKQANDVIIKLLLKLERSRSIVNKFSWLLLKCLVAVCGFIVPLFFPARISNIMFNLKCCFRISIKTSDGIVLICSNVYQNRINTFDFAVEGPIITSRRPLNYVTEFYDYCQSKIYV